MAANVETTIEEYLHDLDAAHLRIRELETQILINQRVIEDQRAFIAGVARNITEFLK